MKSCSKNVSQLGRLLVVNKNCLIKVQCKCCCQFSLNVFSSPNFVYNVFRANFFIRLLQKLLSVAIDSLYKKYRRRYIETSEISLFPFSIIFSFVLFFDVFGRLLLFFSKILPFCFFHPLVFHSVYVVLLGSTAPAGFSRGCGNYRYIFR